MGLERRRRFRALMSIDEMHMTPDASSGVGIVGQIHLGQMVQWAMVGYRYIDQPCTPQATVSDVFLTSCN